MAIKSDLRDKKAELRFKQPEASPSHYRRRNWYSRGLITIVAWIANYLHFTSFGLYEDDWYYAGVPFIVSAKAWFFDSLWLQLINPAASAGRPLQLIFVAAFAELGAMANSFAINYLVAFVLFAASALLMYEVLRYRFSWFVSTLAVLLFVITPLHTLHQFLNGQFGFAPAFIMVFGAVLMYLNGWRRWSYVLAFPTLLTYETVFFLFVGAPLLHRGRILRGRHRQWLIHLCLCMLIVVGYFWIRKAILVESRVTNLPHGAQLIWPLLHSWFFNIFASFTTYIYGFTRLREASIEAWLYAIPFFVIMALLFYRNVRIGPSPQLRTPRARVVIMRAASTGLGFLALGYVLSYFVLNESQPTLHVTDRATRISIAASFGSSIIVALLLSGFVRLHKNRTFRLAAISCASAFLAGLFVYSFVIQYDYVTDWTEQREHAMQLITLTPDAEAESVIIVRLNVADPAVFTKGKSPRGIGAEKYMYESLFAYLYGYGARVPKLLFVYSDDWVQYLKQDTDGLIGFREATFPGRWNPAGGRFRPGQFILFNELSPGWLVRSFEPIFVNGQQIVRQAPARTPRFPLWKSLRPTALIHKVLPDFSWRQQSGGHSPTVVSGVPAKAFAPSQTFTFIGRDADGVGNIFRMYFLVSAKPATSTNTCHGFYDPASNEIYLYDDGLKLPMGPLIPGSPGILKNSQCSVAGSLSSATPTSDTDLTMSLGLSLMESYRSQQQVYFWVKDSEQHDTGWIQTGSWAVR